MNKYEEDLYIDDQALDFEWLDQPNLMFKYTRLHAKAKKELDRVKEKMDMVIAELDRDIRSNPGVFGIDKITETIIRNTIILQKKYTKVKKELIEAQYEVHMIGGAVSAVEHRKQALENMSKLLALEYFAGPKVPRDLSDRTAKEKRAKKSNASIKISRGKK